MVSLETSQIKQFTGRFFHQSGFFEFFPNTTSGIDSFFILGLKINYMEKRKSKLNKTPLHNWRVTGFFKKNICGFGKCDLYIKKLNGRKRPPIINIMYKIDLKSLKTKVQFHTLMTWNKSK
jgi:hypothetical protein